MAKASTADIRAAILSTLPEDGSTIGNGRLRGLIAEQLGAQVSEEDYFSVRDELVQEGEVATGRGRGGSVRRVLADGTPLTLAAQQVPPELPASKSRASKAAPARSRGAAKKSSRRRVEDAANIIAYQHDQKRRNNPDVGVVTPETDPDQPRTTWAYDPHIDPALQFDSGRAGVEKLIDDALEAGSEHLAEFQQELLAWVDHALAGGDEAAVREVVHNLRKRVEEGPPVQPEREALEQLKRRSAPYLNWTGKAERTSFEVDTVSLHVHERIDPASILAVVRKRLQKEKGEHGGTADMFRAWFEEPLPYREAIEFYKHDRGWANRLVTGDSLLVMNSLLQKESMAGQVQMIYIDPPYGIKYGSNFQPFVNKRDVKDRKDEDLTQEPEMIKAFRDTWELGIHSYLTYLRDRLLVARGLLHESGSLFVQISDENVHLVRGLLDEIFGPDQFVAQINYRTMTPLGQKGLAKVYDYVVWYCKKKGEMKFRPIFSPREIHDEPEFRFLSEGGGTYRNLSQLDLQELADEKRQYVFKRSDLRSSGYTPTCVFDFELWGKPVRSNRRKSWRTNPEGMQRLIRANRLFFLGDAVYFRQYHSDFPLMTLENSWSDTAAGFSDPKAYVVQTHDKVIQRCMLMTTDPGDLVVDPTCGSGTTAHVAEKWGRRWITCDTSRVAVTLAKQRLMTASYDYYELKYPHEGLRGGFIYQTKARVSLGAISTNPDVDDIYERMYPAIEQALGRLNASLPYAGAPFKVAEGGRKDGILDFSRGMS